MCASFLVNLEPFLALPENFILRILSSKPLVYSTLNCPGRLVHLLLELTSQMFGGNLCESPAQILAREAPILHWGERGMGWEVLIPQPVLLLGIP